MAKRDLFVETLSMYEVVCLSLPYALIGTAIIVRLIVKFTPGESCFDCATENPITELHGDIAVP